MANAHVPKFGNWEGGGTVPYTQYFDNARKDRVAGKIINPNDPSDNPEAFSEERASPYRTPYTDSPRNDAEANKSPHNRQGDRTPLGKHRRRPSKTSAGSERSMETSPRHPRQLGRYAPSTPGRSRMRPRDEPVERSLAVPKFGEWDESNPASADGFSDIFNNIREERQTGLAKSPISPEFDRKRYGSAQPARCSCFGFCK